MICPYCRAELESRGTLACLDCGTAVHAACANAHGACVTYGCTSTEFSAAGSAALVRRLQPAWPVRTRLRALAKESWGVALAPANDAALAALAGVGVAGLLVRLLA